MSQAPHAGHHTGPVSPSHPTHTTHSSSHGTHAPYDVQAPPPSQHNHGHAYGHHPHQPHTGNVPLGYAVRTPGHFHPLPVIGHAEAWYEKHIQQADQAGDRHAKASHKVGQYVTAALSPAMPWAEKLKRFEHCLHKYCLSPHDADDGLRAFYHKLGDLVRRHAGQEAMQIARRRNEEFHRRQKTGEPRDSIEDDAETFFFDLLGHAGRPDWCSHEAWSQLTAWRDHWV
jgi:hypothetical protein